MNVIYRRGFMLLLAALVVGMAEAQTAPTTSSSGAASGTTSGQPSASGTAAGTAEAASSASTTGYTPPQLPALTQSATFNSLPRFGASLFEAMPSPTVSALSTTPALPSLPATPSGTPAAGAVSQPPLTPVPGAIAPAGSSQPTVGVVPGPGVAPAPPVGYSTQVAASPTTVTVQMAGGGSVPGPGGLSPGAPLVNVPVPPNYVIGPGDVLNLDVWAKSREQINQNFLVSADGYIFLPEVGKMTASGQRLSDLQSALSEAYRQYFVDPIVTLVVAQQRVVEVYVTGEALRPGKYELVGMATVFTALYAAGGPSDIGTYRNVQLTRVGKPAVSIDLYDYLLRGNRDGDLLLQPGDTVFIPPLQAEVGLAGQVRRPARYELKGPTTVAEAVAMAGGLPALGYAPQVQLWRMDENSQWQLTNLNLSRRGGQDGATLLRDGDLVEVAPALDQPNNVAYLVGAVQRPGTYPVGPGTTVRGLLLAAEGPADDAYVGLGVVRRLGPDLHYQTLRFNVADVLAGKAGADVALQPKDIVELYRQEDVEPAAQVQILGAVGKPGQYNWSAGIRVSQLLLLAGGATPDAYMDRGEISRLTPDERREVLPVNLQAAVAGQREADTVLERGDIVTVELRESAVPISQVHIDGFVANPGLYPRTVGMKVSDLIYAAGGLIPGAGPTIELTPGRTPYAVRSVTLKLVGDCVHFQVQPDAVLGDDDSVGVAGQGAFTAMPDMVTLTGEVIRPGAYTIKGPVGTNTYTVWDLLQEGGALLPDASPEGMVVYRLKGSESPSQDADLAKVLGAVNSVAPATPRTTPPVTASVGTGAPQVHLVTPSPTGTDQSGAATSATSATAAAPGTPPTLGLAQQTAAMNQTVTQGITAVLASATGVAIVLPPHPIAAENAVTGIPLDGPTLLASRGREANLVLQDGDVLVVPKAPTVVTVLGAVARSGAVPFVVGKTVDYYLNTGGGLREDADSRHIIVVHANGGAVAAGGHTRIRAGDVIVVPSEHVVRNVRTVSMVEQWLNTIVPLVTSAIIVRKVG